MFQFPGFALKTLCVQVLSTCFSCLLSGHAANNKKLSGGFPHSEIQGSKPILGSPRLIAEYHVLHRLLLPRHPPNALLALDLIQKKTGFFRAHDFSKKNHADQKHHFPAPLAGSSKGTCAARRRRRLVYLTWIVSCLAVEPQIRAHCPSRHETDVYLSIRCESHPDWMAKPSGLTIKSEMVERIGIEPMTPCLQSRCSPS